jgi:cytochrome c oxidase subunit IV
MAGTSHHESIALLEEERTRRVSLTRYASVWIALTGLTFLTWGMSRIDLGGWNVVIALGIATLKAVLVALFFMHLRESSASIRLVVAVTLSLLLLLIGLSAADLAARFQLTTPQPELENGTVR